MSNKVVFVVDIDLRNSPKVRADMSDQAVADYAAIYREDKKKLPPIVLFTEDNHRYLLADGAHRLAAQVGMVKTIVAEVRKGGYEDALAYALLANERHGLRRTPEDKRQCVIAAIKQWTTLPDAEIAKRCAVSDKTVTRVRGELEKSAEVKPAPLRTTSDGKQRPAKIKRGDSEIRESTPKKEKADPDKPKDPTGREIPRFCLQYWRRVDEVKELLEYINVITKAMRQAHRDSDPMFAEVNVTGVIADLDKTWTAVQTAIPYVVCTQCQGHPNSQPKGECRLCKGKGLISKFRWDTVVPIEVKNVLKAQAK